MTPQPPPALIPPANPEKTPEQKKAESDARQLRISIGFCFSGDHGKRVLAHLKARYGWDGDIERPSYRPGMSHADMAFTEGMKEPVRHLLAMTSSPENEPQPKPATTATST